MDVLDQVIGAALDTTSSQGGNGLNYGEYIVLLDTVSAKQGNKGPVFCPEFLVIDSKDVAVDGAIQKATSVGATVGYPCKMLDKPAASNARGFVLAVLGLPETGKDDPSLKGQITTAMKRMCQPDQPLRGLAFKVTTWKHTIKSGSNAGKSFPRLTFFRLPNQTKETIAAGRAKVEGSRSAIAQQQAAQVAAVPVTSFAPAATVAPPAPLAAPSPVDAADPFGGMF